jgi:hypothetical protein
MVVCQSGTMTLAISMDSGRIWTNMILQFYWGLFKQIFPLGSYARARRQNENTNTDKSQIFSFEQGSTLEIKPIDKNSGQERERWQQCDKVMGPEIKARADCQERKKGEGSDKKPFALHLREKEHADKTGYWQEPQEQEILCHIRHTPFKNIKGL